MKVNYGKTAKLFEIGLICFQAFSLIVSYCAYPLKIGREEVIAIFWPRL